MFGDRLRRLRLARGLSVNQFAKLVGKDPGGISRIENGKRLVGTLPAYHDLVRWAEVLGVEVDELAGEISQHLPPPRRVLLTDKDLFERFGIQPYEEPQFIEGVVASAGLGAGVPQDIDDTVPRRRPGSKHLREVPVVGDCMVPDLYPGEVLVYNVRLQPEIGRIMVALRDEEELLIKRLVLDGTRQLLRPNKGVPVPVDERIRFLGAAVSAQRRLL